MSEWTILLFLALVFGPGFFVALRALHLKRRHPGFIDLDEWITADLACWIVWTVWPYEIVVTVVVFGLKLYASQG